MVDASIVLYYLTGVLLASLSIILFKNKIYTEGQRFQTSRISLPAQHDLFFEETKGKNLSTGQTVKLSLQELSQNLENNIKILMLDEWDANLDSQSRKILDEMLSKFSNKILIIEVRHNN